ncbi:hypothetical protein MHU86_5521 [Fragilaria crotonensis]|nr:hypothetical protein MHU86_5521 [Fragilaria crotonensis]
MKHQDAAGFSVMRMPWSDVQALQPQHLKVSPLAAVIPQVGRCGRLVLDLSFAMIQAPTSGGKRAQRAGGTTDPLAPSVNHTTTMLLPVHPVKEVSRVLDPLLRFMADGRGVGRGSNQFS